MKTKKLRGGITFYCAKKGLFCSVKNCRKKESDRCQNEEEVLTSSQIGELVACGA